MTLATLTRQGRPRTANGFAIISVMVLLSVLGALAWTSLAPNALHQRAALAAACQLQAEAAAATVLRQALEDIAAGSAACHPLPASASALTAGSEALEQDCPQQPGCYSLACYARHQRITVLGNGCAGRRTVIQLGRIDSPEGIGSGTVTTRWW